LEFAVTKDGREEPRADGLAGMNRRDGTSAVRVTKEWWLPLILATSNPALRRADMTSLPLIRGSRVTPQ
jgi:hypothetical protein